MDWVSQITAATTNAGYDITTDASGNVYIAGQFSGYTDFDPSAGTYALTSVGIFDAFTAKYGPTGNLIWAVQLGGSVDEGAICKAISLDQDGNVIVVGEFTGTADFDPSAATANLTSFSNDVFVCKLTNAGAYVWAKQIGGSAAPFVFDVAVDSDGNIYTAGYFQSTTDFDPSAATFEMTAVNGDCFLSKLDSDGNFVWAFKVGSTTGDGGYGVYIDDMDHVFLTGTFGNTADFDPSGDTYNLTSTGESDVFLMKLDVDATLIWAISFGGTLSDYAANLTVDIDDNIYVTGYFEGTADFDPGVGVSNGTSNGALDVYLSKFSADGTFLWSRQMGGLENDLGLSVTTDSEGIVYLGGTFRGSVDFDPSAATVSHTSNGNYDMFIEKFDSDGDFISVQLFGGNLADNLKAIRVDGDANIYATGEFNNEVDFDPSAGTVMLTSTGQQDAFILKLKQNSAGISEGNKITEIMLFPNPVLTELVIQTDYKIEEILIYTLTGELVKREMRKQFSVGDLNPGLYILEVRTDAGLIRKRFIKS